MNADECNSSDERPSRFFAIVPAAGRSRRMGAPKLLLPWRGKTLVEHTLAAWCASRVAEIVVVVHPEDHELADVCRAADCHVVQPSTPPEDMKASIRFGLEFIERQFRPTDFDAWLIAPADMPTLSPTVIDQLISEHDPSQPRILVPRHADRRGHPALLPWALREEVNRLAPDEGLNALLDRFPPREVASGPEALAMDVDSADDYRRLSEE